MCIPEALTEMFGLRYLHILSGNIYVNSNPKVCVTMLPQRQSKGQGVIRALGAAMRGAVKKNSFCDVSREAHFGHCFNPDSRHTCLCCIGRLAVCKSDRGG